MKYHPQASLCHIPRMPGPAEKIVNFAKLEALGERLRESKVKIVSTNGCFDILHFGHIQYLLEAKKLGNVLVIGVNTDASVKKLKGPDRPLFPQDVRLQQLAALECVDFVCLFAEPTPENFLRALRPQIHVKGGDYKVEDLPEKRVMDSLGGEVRLLSFVPGYSTSSIIKKLRQLES